MWIRQEKHFASCRNRKQDWMFAWFFPRLPGNTQFWRDLRWHLAEHWRSTFRWTCHVKSSSERSTLIWYRHLDASSLHIPSLFVDPPEYAPLHYSDLCEGCQDPSGRRCIRWVNIQQATLIYLGESRKVMEQQKPPLTGPNIGFPLRPLDRFLCEIVVNLRPNLQMDPISYWSFRLSIEAGTMVSIVYRCGDGIEVDPKGFKTGREMVRFS